MSSFYTLVPNVSENIPASFLPLLIATIDTVVAKSIVVEETTSAEQAEIRKVLHLKTTLVLPKAEAQRYDLNQTHMDLLKTECRISVTETPEALHLDFPLYRRSTIFATKDIGSFDVYLMQRFLTLRK